MKKKVVEVEFEGRLPSGEETTDKAAYKEAWEALAAPLLKKLKLKKIDLLRYDPGICVLYKGRAVHFDTDVVEGLVVAKKGGKE